MRLLIRRTYPFLGFLCLFINLFYLGSETSWATQPTFEKNLATAGISYSQAANNLAITINQNQALSFIPNLQAKGLLSEKVTPETIAHMPTTFAVGIVGVSFTALILQQLYEHNDTLDKLHVEAFLIPEHIADAAKSSCFTFNMTRATYEKINWDNFSPADLIEKTPDFTFSPWCEKQMASEHTG